MKRKNKFLTVVFSFIPGCGQMFQGFMKIGLIMLTAFVSIIFIGEFFDLSLITSFSVIVLSYSFFDSINKMCMDNEEFQKAKDELEIFDGKFTDKLEANKMYKVLAVILICIGGFSIWTMVYYEIQRILFNTALAENILLYEIFSILEYLPKAAISVFALVYGIILIRKKDKQINENNDEE